MASSFSSSDDGVDSSEQEREQTLTAWYSPEIAVNHGPDVFWGLPGLILEVSNGERTLICSQVILNPSDAKAVVPATKGKKVTEAEYEAIMEKQMQKMQRMHGGRKKGDGRGNIEIRIGG
jgi:GLPGLI family protein